MAARSPLTFTPDDLRVLSDERYGHPDPRVQRRMEVVWLISQGETQTRAGQLAGVSKATVERYVAIYRSRGVAGLREFHWVKPVSVLESHRSSLEESFRTNPPHTVFKSQKLDPVLVEAQAGQRDVFFVDAAHFVRGAYLCCVWCFVRMMIRGASGRQRYNVLGAWNAVTRRLIRVSNVTRVSSDTMVELLVKIAAVKTRATTLVLDNARYQHCARVEAVAQGLGIDLLFLTSYSPNLNLIERLWKFTKKKALRGKTYPDFAAFQAAIDDCLDKTATEYQDQIKTLMTLQFQTFDKASFLAA